VKSGQTKRISQRVESDASPSSPNSSISFRVPSVVTQYEHQVQKERETKDVNKDPEPEGPVQDSIAAHKPKKNIRKLERFSDMVVAYALPVEDSVLSLFREAELSSEFELWRNVMVEIESLHVNDTWELVELPKKKVIGCK